MQWEHYCRHRKKLSSEDCRTRPFITTGTALAFPQHVVTDLVQRPATAREAFVETSKT